MQELNTPLNPVPQFDLMKYLDSYKKSINFYNSYGLDKDKNKGGPQTGRPAYRSKTGEVDGKTTFWEIWWSFIHWLILYRFCLVQIRVDATNISLSLLSGIS